MYWKKTITISGKDVQRKMETYCFQQKDFPAKVSNKYKIDHQVQAGWSQGTLP